MSRRTNKRNFQTSESTSWLPEEWEGPTVALAFINIVFYIITIFVGKSIFTTGIDAIILFGFSIDSVKFGLFWTPLTSIFVHGSIAHIGFNLIYLLIFGLRLEERNFEDKAIWIAYISTGIASTVISALLFFNPNAITIGASGAVFGLLGVNVGVEKKLHDPNYKRVLGLSLILFIFSSGANTNVFAHLLGLIFGFLLGYSDYFQGFNRDLLEYR